MPVINKHKIEVELDNFCKSIKGLMVAIERLNKAFADMDPEAKSLLKIMFADEDSSSDRRS